MYAVSNVAMKNPVDVNTTEQRPSGDLTLRPRYPEISRIIALLRRVDDIEERTIFKTPCSVSNGNSRNMAEAAERIATDLVTVSRLFTVDRVTKRSRGTKFPEKVLSTTKRFYGHHLYSQSMAAQRTGQMCTDNLQMYIYTHTHVIGFQCYVPLSPGAPSTRSFLLSVRNNNHFRIDPSLPK